MDILPFTKDTYYGYSFVGKLCTLADYQKIRNHFYTMPANHTTIIIDLKRLTFSSIQGINILCEIALMLKKTGITMLLYKPQEELNTVLSMLQTEIFMPLIVRDDEIETIIQKSRTYHTEPKNN